MAITQDRVKDLVDAGEKLRALLSDFKLRAESALNGDNVNAECYSLVMLLSETSVPEAIVEVLLAEREHLRVTWKRNRANTASAARRRLRREIAGVSNV